MKVLIIGLGSIAKKHIKALHRAKVHNIFALRSSEKAPVFPGVTNLYTIEEVGEQNFDFFLISNITSKHAEVIKALLPFRKPLFIEKPVFSEVNAVNEALVAEVQTTGILTYVGCSLRFLDSLNHIKKILQDYRVNEVTVYSGSYLPNWRPNVNFRESYSANKEMGGGVHIDLIHELDYLYWIFGEPDDTRSDFSSKSSLEISAVDYANYLWKYSGFSASVTLNYFRVDSKRCMEIVTSDATFEVDLLKNSITKDGKEIFTSDQTMADTLYDQMDFFLDDFLNKKVTGFNSIEEAYKILSLCLKD